MSKNDMPVFTPQEHEGRFKHQILPLTVVVSSALCFALLFGIYWGFANFTVWLSQQKLPSVLTSGDIGCGYSYSGYCYDGISKKDALANGLTFYAGACSGIYSCQFSYASAQTSGEEPPDDDGLWWDPFCGQHDGPYEVPSDGWPDSPRDRDGDGIYGEDPDDQPDHGGVDILCDSNAPVCLPPGAGTPTPFGEPDDNGCGLGITFNITIPYDGDACKNENGCECSVNYCHLNSNDLDNPLCGDTGNAGNAGEDPQLHIHIECDGERIDPRPFLPPVVPEEPPIQPPNYQGP